MKATEAYETTDGKLFKHHAEALRHQKDIDFTAWYENNRIYGDYTGSKVDTLTIKDWLKENKAVILHFLASLD